MEVLSQGSVSLWGSLGDCVHPVLAEHSSPFAPHQLQQELHFANTACFGNGAQLF